MVSDAYLLKEDFSEGRISEGEMEATYNINRRRFRMFVNGGAHGFFLTHSIDTCE